MEKILEISRRLTCFNEFQVNIKIRTSSTTKYLGNTCKCKPTRGVGFFGMQQKGEYKQINGRIFISFQGYVYA